MATVRFSGPNNSTTFTTCCGTAVFAEKYCPSCGEEVFPYDENASRHRICQMRFSKAFEPYRRKANEREV